MKPEVLRSQIELELCGDFFGWFLMNSPHYLDVLNGDLSEVPFIVLGTFGCFSFGGHTIHVPRSRKKNSFHRKWTGTEIWMGARMFSSKFWKHPVFSVLLNLTRLAT